MAIDFRPWMIEAASDYITAARLLWGKHLGLPSNVNAALGMEILLKSFLAEVDGQPGTIGEQYVFDKRTHGIKGHGHNLAELFNAIPRAVKYELELHRFGDWITEFFQQPFIINRYPYEKIRKWAILK